MNETSKDPRPESASETRYKAMIERSRSEPDKCTIYAPDEDDEAEAGEWITAVEGSYVFVELMR